MTTITSTSPVETQQQAPEQQQPVVLGVQDLQNLLIVMDLAAQRGAFRANEMAQIGALFDKVNQFVASTQSQQDNQAASAAEPVPTPVSPMTPPFAPKVSV